VLYYLKNSDFLHMHIRNTDIKVQSVESLLRCY